MFSIFVYQPEVQLAVLQSNQIANCRIHGLQDIEKMLMYF